MRAVAKFLPLFLFLAACSSKSPVPEPSQGENPFKGGGFLLEPSHTLHPLGGDFSRNPAAERFVDKMVREHSFDRQQLHDVLAQAKQLDWVIKLMDRQAPVGPAPVGPNGAWLRYRAKFITPDNIPNGVAFWQRYQNELQRAYEVYGVPPEIIVGIIGVETRWGRVMGKTRIIDALATLAFNYPRRADFFSAELETFLLMARTEGDDPLDLRGSYAGAMGYGQFMPSSFKQYAVDFNHDGHINLWDPVDAIGSVANYFKSHGWQRDGEVAIMANGQAPNLANGFNTQYSPGTLAAAGVSPQSSISGYQQVSLLRLDMGNRYQYWYGLPNFYVITRYNHSTHYAMAVWQLGQAVKMAR
nr:lytic murein transglycosylase B [Pantoea sp. 201603H]